MMAVELCSALDAQMTQNNAGKQLSNKNTKEKH